MKKMKRILTVVLIFFIIIASAGCGNNDTTSTEPVGGNEVSSSKTAKVLENQYSLVQKTAADYLNNATLDIIPADEVYQKVVVEQDLDYLVVDIRDAATYAKGSIEGAVNIPYNLTAQENMITRLPKDKKIVVVCFTGHQAGQTAALWSMLGYDATPMLNGMNGWNKTVSTLPTGALGYPTVKEASYSEGTYDLPKFEEKEVTDVNSLLLAKSSDYINAGKSVTLSSEKLVAADSTENLVIDIRSAEDYNKGHIDGAINVEYKTVMSSENLAKLPNDKSIVIVGYNGSDASQLTRILSMVGYDAYALKYGMRAWAQDDKYTVSKSDIENYPLKKLQYDTESSGSAVVGCG